MIERRIGELVDHRLIDGDPVRNAEFLAHKSWHVGQRNLTHATHRFVVVLSYCPWAATLPFQAEADGAGRKEVRPRLIRKQILPAAAGQNKLNIFMAPVEEDCKTSRAVR
ncbi:hypothetical protein D3C73_1384190 [compost metagenome]